eukprot:gene1517-biopygen10956
MKLFDFPEFGLGRACHQSEEWCGGTDTTPFLFAAVSSSYRRVGVCRKPHMRSISAHAINAADRAHISRAIRRRHLKAAQIGGMSIVG